MTESLSHKQLVAVFERMLLIRRFEEAVIGLKDRFADHYHVSIGQEATAAMAAELLRPGDLALSTHRNHGHLIARGADPGRGLAEVLGRSGGLNGGRGGSLHLCDRSAGFLSTSAVVGNGLGLALGAGYALNRGSSDAVAVAFFGDGALEEGVAFESMNMAALWSLPVLFLCENNSPGATAVKEGGFPSSAMAVKTLADIPRSLGIHSVSVDGADLEALHAVLSDAVARLRRRAGPVFVEAITERWPGTRPMWPVLATGKTALSAAWEPERIGGEHAHWIDTHDPVIRAARLLLRLEVASREDMMALDGRVRERVRAAEGFALGSPPPPPESALEGVFAEQKR